MGQSPYYVSAVRECVWFTGRAGVSSDAKALRSDIRGRRVHTLSTLSLSPFFSLMHSQNATTLCHRAQRWSASLRDVSPRAVVPASCGRHAVPRTKKKKRERHFRRILGQFSKSFKGSGQVKVRFILFVGVTPESISL